jgi:hypothetical protein
MFRTCYVRIVDGGLDPLGNHVDEVVSLREGQQEPQGCQQAVGR